tara:strand:+ start:17917 stop:18102 length:186 start_codon:yes stop_codon:yes gene_type:complete
MSIRKKYLLPLDQLQKEFALNGHNKFYDKYIKEEVFLGSEESVNFVNSILEKGKIKAKIQK